MVGLRWAHRLVGIVSVAFLARLLAPEDFGLVALATATIAFLDLFGQTQVDVALIRNHDVSRELYDSAWTMDILRAAAVAVVIAAIALPAAAWFSEPRLERVLYAVAVIQLVVSFQNIGTVQFRKHLHFQRDFLFEFSSRIAGTVLTIAAAYVLRDYWALVVGIALQGCSRLAMSYALSDYRPRLCVARLREIFGFSKWMIVQNLTYGLREQAPVFAVSRLLNVEALGLFNVAKEVSAFVTTELRAPVRRALYPGFARMSLENGALKAGAIDAFAILLFLSLPISTGLYVVADLIIPVLLGPRWLPAVPLLQILAIVGIIQSFGINTHLVLNRLGRPKVNALAGAVFLTFFAPALFWATATHGTQGAAWAIVAGSALLTLTEYVIMNRVLGIRAGELVVHAWRPVISAACMVIMLDFARSSVAGPLDGRIAPVVLLAGMVALGAVVYGATAWIAWRLSGAGPGAERHVLSTLGRIVPARWLLGA